jgi:hypothetical protein
MDNTISINIKSDLNLRDSPRCRGDSLHIELAKHFVISHHLPFALEHPNTDSGLVVTSCAVHLALFGGNGGVAVDHPSEHSP